VAADFGLSALEGSRSAGGCPTGPVGGPEADRAIGNPGATGLSPPQSHAIEPPGVFSEHKQNQA